MTLKSKGKQKILIDEEFETNEQEDTDVVIKEAINKTVRIVREKKKSL